MKSIKILLLFILITLTQNLFSQSGWYSLNPVTSSTLCDISFPNPNIGILISYSPSLIFRTTNGGTNWVQIPYNAGAIYFYKVQLVDENTGWIVGCEIGSSPANIILKTTNSGLNWFPQYQGTGTLRTISFINLQTGWAAGVNLLKTTNSGINWIESSPAGLIVAYELQFINENTGWASGLPPTSVTIIKTTNSGDTWFTQLNGNESPDIYFVSSETGFCAMQDGIKKTTNGGTTWFLTYSCDYGCSISFVNEQTGWIIAQYSNPSSRKILRTTNAGANWTDQGYNNPIFLTHVHMYSETTGWAIGHEGIIYKTTNGGEPVGIKTISSLVPEHFSLFQNYPNPFNPATIIKFDIPKEIHVKIVIYDVLGKIIQTLLDANIKAGKYEIGWDESNYPSGVYFYKLETAEFTQTRKMVLLK